MILLAPAFLARLRPILEPMEKAEGSRRACVVLEPPPQDVDRGSAPPLRGTVHYQGLTVWVENPCGTVRRGKDPAGTPWATTMTAHYGEFAGTRGVDGDAVDVFVAEDPDAPIAYVVHRKHPGTEVYDEDKVILGCRSAREAEALFRANYDKPGNIGGVTPWPIDELREYLAHPGHEGRRLDQPKRVRILLRKGPGAPSAPRIPLRQLLKAVIRTPTGADGKVDYDSVPVGASIWVRVSDPHSPMHGRPILLTKRPDHQFALTGGSGAKHIKARQHLVVSSGRTRATKVDEAATAARQGAEEKNAPIRERQRALRGEARHEQGAAESAFMDALGIKRRGLSREEKATVHETALVHARAQGLDEASAASFAKHVADGIARKERELVLRKTAHRLEVARHVAAGREQDEAETMAGPEPGPTTYTAPPIQPEVWKELSEPAREAAVAGSLDEQDAAQVVRDMEGTRFEGKDAEPADEVPVAPRPTEATGGEPTPTPGPTPEELPGAQAATPTITDPEATSEPPPTGPTFVVGKEEEPAVAPAAVVTEPGEGASAPSPPGRQPVRPILSQERAQAALDHFRRYAQARKDERAVAGGLEKLVDTADALPASVEDLRLRVGAVDDAELGKFLDEYVARNEGPPDTAFYSAMSPHWNDDIGNKLSGAVTAGAASAITGLVGEATGARFDVQRLVDALGPEAAAMAVVHRMREELGPDEFGSWVTRLRDHNAENQVATERRAMDRHLELRGQAEDLERQISAGDLSSHASTEVLRARNLLAQRENLGTALGSLQASAALYHFADLARGERHRKQDVVINVGSKVALVDKLKRLGKVRATTSYHPTLGYQVHTDTDALRKFVGRTESDRADADHWRSVKYDTSGIEADDDGREWVPGYQVPGFRSHVADESSPYVGQPFHLLADQRNNIEWLHGAGGGLVTVRTGGGKTITSLGVAAKMLHENARGRHLRIVPDGREEQWANEVRNFTHIPVVVLPASSTKDERTKLLAAAPEGSVVIVGHTHAGRYDHEALAATHAWDSIGIDEPQELRAKSGSGKLSAGARRILKIQAKNRHALTATPASEHPVEAFDIVNWARPRALGFRTRFKRAFDGFGGGTNAQDAALERALYRELEPHVSGERLIAPHYGIEHDDRRVSMSSSQLAAQRDIEARADTAVQTAVEDAKQKKRDGVHGYAERSFGALAREARDRAMAKLEAEHRLNLSSGGIDHNPKLAAMRDAITESPPDHRHVIFVDGPEQRRAVTAMLDGMGHKGKVKNITASAKGDTVKRGGAEVSAIEERKRDWKATPGGFILIDRTSGSGHNLAEGDHLHVLGDPDDAAQLLQAHGRLGRANRVGDFAIHTFRYNDSPFEHAHWNRLERQLKVLRATSPGMFVEGKRREPLAKAGRFRLLVRRVLSAVA